MVNASDVISHYESAQGGALLNMLHISLVNAGRNGDIKIRHERNSPEAWRSILQAISGEALSMYGSSGIAVVSADELDKAYQPLLDLATTSGFGID